MQDGEMPQCHSSHRSCLPACSPQAPGQGWLRVWAHVNSQSGLSNLQVQLNENLILPHSPHSRGYLEFLQGWCPPVYLSLFITFYLSPHRSHKQDLSNFQNNMHQLDILSVGMLCSQMTWSRWLPSQQACQAGFPVKDNWTWTSSPLHCAAGQFASLSHLPGSRKYSQGGHLPCLQPLELTVDRGRGHQTSAEAWHRHTGEACPACFTFRITILHLQRNMIRVKAQFCF